MISKIRKRTASIARGEEGFTLIELMIVIAVLGILAGIAIPQFTGVQDKAEVAAKKSELKSVQTGLEMYYASKSNYPANLSDITQYVENIPTDGYSYTTSGSYDYTVETSSKVGDKFVTLTPGGISENSNSQMP